MDKIKAFLAVIGTFFKSVFSKGASVMKSLNWKDIFKIVGVFVLAGISWAANHENTIYGLVVVAVVWIVNLVFLKTGTHMGKRALTIIVYSFAVVLAFILHPASWPALPVMCAVPPAALVAGCAADPSAYGNLLIAWIGSVVALGSGVFAFATVVYNTLLEAVLAKLGPNAPA